MLLKNGLLNFLICTRKQFQFTGGVPHLCLITEKVPFVNSKPGLEYRYFWKLWVLDISIKPYLLSWQQTFFTDYPTSTTLNSITTPNQQIDSFALSFSTHIQTVRCVGRGFNFLGLWSLIQRCNCHVQIQCFIYHYIPFLDITIKLHFVYISFTQNKKYRVCT